MARHPLHVRIARVAFWGGAFTLAGLISLFFLAFFVWLLVVNWQILGP